ncbi:MAG: hypothetical protein ACRDGA_02675 [Bacteroidota bacterium]
MMELKFDNSVNVGQILQLFMILVPGVWWASSVHAKVANIEKKLEKFVTRDEVEVIAEGRDREHEAMKAATVAGDAALRREINHIKGRR